MSKKEMLTALLSAKNTHIAQMEAIDNMIKRERLIDNLISNKDMCDFGRWLYDDKSNLKELIGSLFFRKLDEEYRRWHSESSKIYKILSEGEKRKSLLGLIGFAKKDSMKFEKSAVYYEEMKIKSHDLLKILASCERRLSALADSKFK